MAILRVQGPASGTTTSNSISVTLGSTPINGNVLVAVIGTRVSSGFADVSSISQSGVTWTRQIQKHRTTSAYLDEEIWYGVVGASASASLTVNLSQNADYGGICIVCEYSGLLTSGFLDKTATNEGASATGDTGSTTTTTQDVELWVGTVGDQNDVYSNPTNGFTLVSQVAQSATRNAYVEKIVSATGIADCSLTIANSNYWAGCIATFKGVAGVAHYKTCSEILGLVDGKSTKTAFHKTASEVLGLVDNHDKNKCSKCKPSSVILTF